jgi:hypothetical protein
MQRSHGAGSGGRERTGGGPTLGESRHCADGSNCPAKAKCAPVISRFGRRAPFAYRLSGPAVRCRLIARFGRGRQASATRCKADKERRQHDIPQL